AQHCVIEFTKEFELLYYQRHPERIHMIRQSVHTVGHYPREVETKGPLICASQWTMECALGYLVSQIRQPSNPYANLAE
ncbi:hypothetical protein DFH29DRAFT_818587, partial [Suillus ampliporus]